MTFKRAAIATGAALTAMMIGTVPAHAASTHSSAAVVSDRAAATSSGQDYARGYRAGYVTGFYDARHTCQSISHGSHHRSRQSDYERGFSAGYDQGFNSGIDRFCSHRRY